MSRPNPNFLSGAIAALTAAGLLLIPGSALGAPSQGAPPVAGIAPDAEGVIAFKELRAGRDNLTISRRFLEKKGDVLSFLDRRDDPASKFAAGSTCDATGLGAVCDFQSKARASLGEGDDQAVVSFQGQGFLDGGPGADQLIGGPLADTLEGGDGDDRLEGAGEPPTLLAQLSAVTDAADSFRGGPGNDLILARDGQADAEISCGPGNDRVVADLTDPVSSDCEVFDNGREPGKTEGGGDAGVTPPEVEIVSRIVSVSRSGKAKVRVRCIYRASRCRGTVKLVNTRTVSVRSGKKRIRLGAGKSLAKATVEVPWGTSEAIKLKLPTTVAKVLAKRSKGVTARGDLTASDSAAGSSGAVGKAQRKLTLVRG